MPSKDRINVTFTKNKDKVLYETIKRDAELNERSDSAQVIFSLRQYYAGIRKQAELFTPTRLREAGEAHVPVFETPAPPAVEPASKPRAATDRERS